MGDVVSLTLRRELARCRTLLPNCVVTIERAELVVFIPLGSGGASCRVQRASDAVRMVDTVKRRMG